MSDKEFLWEIKDLCKQGWSTFNRVSVVRLLGIIEQQEKNNQQLIEWLEIERVTLSLLNPKLYIKGQEDTYKRISNKAKEIYESDK